MYFDFTMLAYTALGIYLLIAAVFVAGGYTFYRLIKSRPKVLNAPQASTVQERDQGRGTPIPIQAQGEAKAGISRAA